jgi:hypothetical protein
VMHDLGFNGILTRTRVSFGHLNVEDWIDSRKRT